LIHVFLAEKSFEGADGLAVGDDVRVMIAAQACLLLLHRDTDFYPGLRSIVVYPRGFVVETEEELDDGTVIEGQEERSGESWYRGSVVLAWDDVLGGAATMRDGYNVVIHEFAHQLDNESGQIDGAPNLGGRARYREWASVFTPEYERLIDDVAHHRKTVLDKYGATHPAEFFAVATETFFEKPRALRRRHPELYAQLMAYFQQDPAVRFERAGRA